MGRERFEGLSIPLARNPSKAAFHCDKIFFVAKLDAIRLLVNKLDRDIESSTICSDLG